MMKIFKILTATALLYAFSFTFSASHAQDAEYNLIRRTYKVNGDGTMDISFRKEIKLLRNRAITAYADKGETFILYNPAIDELRINESYTIRKDGSRVQTPPNAFIDQLPSQCQDCGRYNGIRERVVVHTALEYDCIIVLDYTIHHRGDLLDETILFAEDCPVKEYEVIVDAPAGSLFSAYSIDKKVKRINDEHYIHLVAKNLPQKSIEGYQPDDRAIYPYVQFIYGQDPYTIIAMAWENLPEADYLLGELYEKDPVTYATNIRDYVADNVHTTDFPLFLVNYEVAPAKTTFLSNCGTPRDKEWLTVALLRQAGFFAEDKENNGLISFNVKENGMDLSYTLSTHDKRPARLDGAAVDEQRTIEIEQIIPWQGENLGGGYSRMTLPTERGSINIDPARLTSNRKAPLQVRNCNEKYHYTIQNAGTMVGKPVNISRTVSGLGSIKISIKPSGNGAIDVVRELNIDVPYGIVMPKQYKAFRKMMQDWTTSKTVTVRAENGRPVNQ